MDDVSQKIHDLSVQLDRAKSMVQETIDCKAIVDSVVLELKKISDLLDDEAPSFKYSGTGF